MSESGNGTGIEGAGREIGKGIEKESCSAWAIRSMIESSVQSVIVLRGQPIAGARNQLSRTEVRTFTNETSLTTGMDV